MKNEEFEKYLNSINGLKNGYFTDRERITSRYFFEVNDGWLDLIHDLIADLIKLGWDKEICQVKEKFGGLRFYINGGSVEIFDRISKAEADSYNICEICGTIENVGVTSGWISVLCESCWQKTTKNSKWVKNK